MPEFAIRLLVGVLLIFLFDRILAIIAINPQAKQILEVVLIIVVVLYVLFGGAYLPFR